MFNEELANNILERLGREFPTTMTVAQLREALPEFSSQTRNDWFVAVDAMQKEGLVGCRILRSGMDLIDDVGPIVITERGRQKLHAVAGASKDGLFISHIAEERAVAQLLKDFLRATFGIDLKIFVSSDYESIQSGEQWFNSIVDALRSAQMILVLLSEVSVERRWINFEAGVGVGAHAQVVPVVYRGLAKENIGLPLSVLHARSLSDPEDVRALVSDIRRACRLDVKGLNVDSLVSDLRQIDRELPSKRALLIPCISPNPYGLKFRLENTGNRDIELLMIEASVPKRYLAPSWTPVSDPNVIEVINHAIGTEAYLTLRFKAFDGPTHPHFGIIERLPRLLAVGMPAYELKPPFAFALRAQLKVADGVDVPILYATYAKGMQPERGETTYRKLVMDSFRK